TPAFAGANDARDAAPIASPYRVGSLRHDRLAGPRAQSFLIFAPSSQEKTDRGMDQRRSRHLPAPVPGDAVRSISQNGPQPVRTAADSIAFGRSSWPGEASNNRF